MSERRVLLPTEEEKTLSQSDLHIVQRPPGIGDVGGVKGVGQLTRTGVKEYSGMRADPGNFLERFVFTTGAGLLLFPLDVDLGFQAHSWLVDNYTNQWILDRGIGRGIPPYSFGWVLPIPRGAAKAEAQMKPPVATYIPAAVIAGEYAWICYAEAFLPPQTGIIDRVKAPVVA